MFHLTSCPTCQTKFTIPEAAVGTRQVCPHCQSPFLAGKSLAVADVPMSPDPVATGPSPAAAAYNKTMMAEQAPPIHYNCPRCKKALESPAIEAGTKKPCPHCGQRLQVPAAPPPSAGQPNLNKTLLASDESNLQLPPIRYNCPNCKRPLESPASEALTKKPCPYCSQRLQVPAAPSAKAPQPNLNKTLLASDENQSLSVSGSGQQALFPGTPPPSMPGVPASAGQPGPATFSLSQKQLRLTGIVAGGILLLLFLSCLISTPFARSARQHEEEAKKALEDLKKQIQEKESLLKQAELLMANLNAQIDKMQGDFVLQQNSLKKEYELQLIRIQTDKQEAAKLKYQHEEQMMKIEQAKKEADLKFKQQQEEFKAKMDLLQNQVNQAQQQKSIIIQQAPAPPPYYYRWHPAYGWGYW